MVAAGDPDGFRTEVRGPPTWYVARRSSRFNYVPAAWRGFALRHWLQEIECRPHEAEAHHYSAKHQTDKNRRRKRQFGLVRFHGLNKINHSRLDSFSPFPAFQNCLSAHLPAGFINVARIR